MKTIITFFLCLWLIACDTGNNFAPVTDISGMGNIPKSGMHSVLRGETLYEIAWRYGLDYRYLASINHISAPYTIQVNQIIYLNKNSVQVTKIQNGPAAQALPLPENKPVKLSAAENKLLPIKEPNYAVSKWVWPAQRKVISQFSAVNKGINIAGQKGESIYSIGPGKIVYAGNGLRGYGNLIIVKHNSLYLSAYAHNSRILVNEGQWIKRGQKIAEMGDSGADKTMLHFEIRRAGKPINPMSLYQR